MYFKYLSYAALLSTIFWIQILYLLLYSIYFNALVKKNKPRNKNKKTTVYFFHVFFLNLGCDFQCMFLLLGSYGRAMQ